MTTELEKFEAQIPLLLRVLENSLRAGYSLKQALEIVAKDLPAPAGREVQQVLSDLNDGIALPAALAGWLRRVPSHDLDLVAATVNVQLEVGGNLADKFNLLGQILNKRALTAAK